MKIKLKCMCLLLTLFSFCSKTYSIVNFNDGGIHNIYYPVDDSVTIDFKTPGMYTTVNWVSGASTGMHYSLLAYEDSLLNIYGGEVDYILYAFQRSQVNIYGGWIGRFLDACDSSKVTIHDVIIDGDILAVNNGVVMLLGGIVKEDIVTMRKGSVTIKGGNIDGTINAGYFEDDACNITIAGYDFMIDGVRVDYGRYYANDFSSGKITGILLNGGYLDNSFEIIGNSSFVLIPEPATLSLLTLGTLALLRKS